MSLLHVTSPLGSASTPVLAPSHPRTLVPFLELALPRTRSSGTSDHMMCRRCTSPLPPPHAVEECSMASGILIATSSFQPVVSPFRRREMTVETSARFGTAVYSPKYTFNLPSPTASDALPCHAHFYLPRPRLACPSCPRCRTPSAQRARYPRSIQSIASS
jgi:hypothetical protein